MADSTISVRTRSRKSGAATTMESFQHLIQHIKQYDPMLYEALKKTYEQTRANTLIINEFLGEEEEPEVVKKPPPDEGDGDVGDLEVFNLEIGGVLVSHLTGVLITGTIHYPTTHPNYARLKFVEVEFRFPALVPDGKGIVIARYGKPTPPATTQSFEIRDDRILLGFADVPGCEIEFYTVDEDYQLGPNPLIIPVTLPKYGLSAVSGTEDSADRWQTKDTRQVHSVVPITVVPVNSIPFYTKLWTNHSPTGSPNGPRRMHGWFPVEGNTTVTIGAEGTSTELYSPLDNDETWTATAEVWLDESNEPTGLAINGPIIGTGPSNTVARAQLPVSGLITSIEVSDPIYAGNFPYDLLEAGEITHKWSIANVSVATDLAYNAVNVFTVIITAQDLGIGGTPICPEHPFHTPVPVKDVTDFGKLEGPYGDEATPPRTGSIESVRLRAYLANRTNQTTSAYQDPNAATLQATRDVIVAVGGAVPSVETPPPGDPIQPGDVTIGEVTIRYYGGKVLISIAYTPPSPLKGFDRLHAYLYAPDTVITSPASIGDQGFVIPADSSGADEAGYLPSKVGGPSDKGSFKYDSNNLIVSFEHEAPLTGLEHWRAVLVSGSVSVPEKDIGESPFVLFDVEYDDLLGTKGEEYAPNYKNGTGQWYEDQATIKQMLPTMWFALQWILPLYDPRWDRVVSWELYITDPTKPDAQPGHIASLARDATAFTLTDRWNLTYSPVTFVLWLVPKDKNGNINTFVKGINDIATFTVKTNRGLQLQYADGSVINGIDFEADPATNTFKIKNLDLTKVYGPSYTSEFKVVGGKFQWGDNLDFKKFDPAKVGPALDLDALTGILDFPFNSAEFDAASGQFVIKALKAELFGSELGPDGSNKIVIKNLPPDLFGTEFGTDGSGNIYLKDVDFTKAKPGTFSPEFSKGTGSIFQVEKLSADKIKTGILEVGGAVSGGERVSRFKVFDTAATPGLIGWIGDDRDASGYIGAWFKRVLIGGDSPANAKIVADADGNVGVPAGIITAGTLVAGVIYSGFIAANKIQAGTLNSGVINTGDLNAIQIKTGTLSIGASNQAGQMLIYTTGGALIGWIGTYNGYEGGWLRRILLGGTDPANAKIATDINGNLTITGGTLTAPQINSATITTAAISGGNISGATLTLFHATTNITTSIQVQNGNAPVVNTYVGLRVSNSNGNWAGMSDIGTGQFTPSGGYAITFSDAFQVYDDNAHGNAVMVRVGVDRGTRTPGIWFNGVKVLNSRFEEEVTDMGSLIRCLRHHGLCR